jgi:hypothetical protein
MTSYVCANAYNSGTEKTPVWKCSGYNERIAVLKCDRDCEDHATITGLARFCSTCANKYNAGTFSARKDMCSLRNRPIETHISTCSLWERAVFTPTETEQTAKETTGKLDLTTVPPIIIEEIAKVREYGIQKYKKRDNWKDVEIQEHYKAIYRHWIALQKGETYDKESGLHHLSHIACNCAFILELEVFKGDGNK